MKRLFLLLIVCSLSIAQDLKGLKFIDDYTLPDSALDLNGSRIGGLSSMYYDDATKLLYAISDDPGVPGTKGRENPRYYTFKVDLSDKALKVTPDSVLVLKKDSQPVSPGKMDLESIVRLKNGNYLLSSEGQAERTLKHKLVDNVPPTAPELLELATTGEWRRDYSFDSKFSPPDWSEKQGLSPAQGIEAMFANTESGILDRNDTLITITEGPTYQDKALSLAHARVSLFDRLSSPMKAKKEFIYVLEPHPTSEKLGFKAEINDNGVSDVLRLTDKTFLVIERGFYSDKKNLHRNIIRLFKVYLKAGAPTDVKNYVALPSNKKLTPLKKELFFDLDKILDRLKPPPHEIHHPLDNIECITWGPTVNGKRTILLASDDNFGAKQRNLFLAFIAE